MTTNKRDAAHVKALDDLEQRKTAGTISASEYDIRRAKVISEASERPMNVGVAILLIFGVLIVLGIVARVFVAVVIGN
jgi:hypothetical protein